MELHEMYKEVIAENERQYPQGITTILAEEIKKLEPLLKNWLSDETEKDSILNKCHRLNEATKQLGFKKSCSLIIPAPISILLNAYFAGQFYEDEIENIDNWGQESVASEPYLMIGAHAQQYQPPKWYWPRKQNHNGTTIMNLTEALFWLARDEHVTDDTRYYSVRVLGKLILVRHSHSLRRIKIFHPKNKVRGKHPDPQLLLTCSQRKSY